MSYQKDSKDIFPTLILVGAGFFLFFSTYFLTSSFYKSLSLAEESAFKRLETITKSLSIIIDGDKHQKLTEKFVHKDQIKNNSDDPYYEELSELLAYTKDINNLNTDIYTWFLDSNSSNTPLVRFGVSSSEKPYFRHEWKNFPKEMIPIFYLGGELKDYKDENGRWISYFYPIYNSNGTPIGSVQADIEYNSLVAEIRSSALKKGFALLVSVLFFLILLMWIMDKLHKKQKALIETQVLETKYRKLIDSSLDFIFIVNTDLKITYLNKVFVENFGEEGILKNSFLNIVSKNQREKTKNIFEKIKETGKNQKEELLIQSPSGNTIWMELIFVPTFKNEQINGFQITGRDFTEAKKLKVKIGQERIKAIQSLKSKENFFANMSHEIRTPLNAIIGMESLINKSNLPDQEKEYLANIKFSAKGLLQIINDILDYSKIEAGKLHIERTPFKIKTITETIKRTFGFKFEEKGIDLVLDIDPSVENTTIESDSLRLNQVVINLVSNALKFTKKGSVTVSISISNPNSPILKISVKDTGIGIPENRKPDLFQSFTQAKEDTSRKFGGTGLGLAICKKICELLKGEISVESNEGAGSVFKLSIPVIISAEESVPVQIPNDDIDLSPLKDIRILVAEDNPINTVYISGILDEMGLNHSTVENGEQAVEILKKEKFDLVLMDIQMPVLNGYEATQQIRNKLKLNIPIIALTANAFPEDRKKVFDNGMDGFVSKPFEYNDLITELIKHVKTNIKADEKQIEQSLVESKEMELKIAETYYSLDKLKSISNGNQSFVDKMVHIFIEETPLNITLFEELKKCHDVNRLGATAHKIKPTVDMFQIKELSTIVREIEEISKNDPSNKKALQEKTQIVIKGLSFVLNDLKLNRP